MTREKNGTKLPPFIFRMVRAAKLDVKFDEGKEDYKVNNLQACLCVILTSLATSTGFGIAWIFKWAGLWSIWVLLIILIYSIFAWLLFSFFTYFIGNRLIKSPDNKVTFGELSRTIGFSASPGVFGFFVFIPTVGVFIWLGATIWALISGVVLVKNKMNFSPTRAVITSFTSWLVCLIFVFVITITLLSFLVEGSCGIGGRFDSRVNSIVEPYRFSLIAWEFNSIPDIFSQWKGGISTDIDNAAELVTDYFSGEREHKVDLKNTVESILEYQIKESLIEQGIYGFPPINLKLDTMPNLIVISPRDKIESMREIMLEQDLSIEEILEIEDSVDELDVSSLVVRIGGFGGTYPSFVTDNAGLTYTIEASVEEWVHQYLAFKPLGFRYLLDLLGIERNYEIATINETVAGMVSDEISAIIYDKYYNIQEDSGVGPSDFDLEMRAIRLEVDNYLASGQIELAEAYMEQKRQYLVSMGYDIRKLNQAYFAWHGTYANEPSSVSPIGEELRQLRSHCQSIKEFLDSVSTIISRQDLREKVGISN